MESHRMKESKKPKGFKPGSLKGKATQYLSDSLKRMAEEGHVWVTRYIDGDRYRAKLLPVPDDLEAFPGHDVLVKGKGGFRWAGLMIKDGIKVGAGKLIGTPDGGKTGHTIFHVDPANIMAVVETIVK
jgi:hypothetical protein